MIPVPVVYLPHQDPPSAIPVSPPPAYPGATRVAMAIDFRLATGRPLVGVGRGAEGTLKEMAQMFRTLVRRVVQITDSGRTGLPSKSLHRCRAVLPLGGPVLPGLTNRPF